MAINPDDFILLSSTLPDFEVINEVVTVTLTSASLAPNTTVSYEGTPINAPISLTGAYSDVYNIIPTGWDGYGSAGAETNGLIFYIALEGGGAVVGLIAYPYAKISGDTLIPGVAIRNNGTVNHTIPNTVVTMRAIARQTPAFIS